MPLLRSLVIAAALLAASAPAFAQRSHQPAPQHQPQHEPKDRDTVRITATTKSGKPTMMAYLADHPLPTTVEGLVARLNEPNMCGNEDWPAPQPYKPCAIIVYYLADRDEARFTPQLVFRAIYFVSHPDNPADTALQILDLNGHVLSYSADKLDEPLRPMRVPNSCYRTFDFNLEKEVKRCQRVQARYLPIGIFGYLENDKAQILTGKVKDAFFTIGLNPDDLKNGSGLE